MYSHLLMNWIEINYVGFLKWVSEKVSLNPFHTENVSKSCEVKVTNQLSL